MIKKHLAGTALLAVLPVAGCTLPQAAERPTAHPASSAAPAATAKPAAAHPSQAAPTTPAITAIGYPQVGSRRWTTASGRSAVVGEGGTLLRFQVAVEKDIQGIDPQQFAAAVFATLSDSRSWIAGERFRFQRVGPGEARDFTLYLATPATRDALCGEGYDRYTSCRNGNRVVLNVARWVHGVPRYGAGLATYRQYMVNHEVGHRLGHGHELCPGKGEPAPVMEQQTLGLHGCTANPWPYPDGTAYTGPSGQYDDPVPAA